MTGLRLYGRYAAASVRSQLQYRANIVMQSVGIFVVTLVEVAGVWALFARFDQLRGWQFPEVALFYGIVSIAWAICDAIGHGFDTFGTLVKAGDFDRLLLRPRGAVLQLLGQELTLRRVGRLAQGVVVLGYAFVSLDLDWTLPRALLLVAAIASAVCVFLGLLILQATTAFWTTESLEVWNAFTFGGVAMSQYPLSIYRWWLRGVFLYVIPLGCASYLPGLAILGRADPLGSSVELQWLAPLAGPGFLCLALAAWRLGVRRYRSTGS